MDKITKLCHWRILQCRGQTSAHLCYSMTSGHVRVRGNVVGVCAAMYFCVTRWIIVFYWDVESSHYVQLNVVYVFLDVELCVA